MARFNVVGDTFGQVWYDLLDELCYYGDEARPRGLPIKERLAVSLTVTDALANVLMDPLRALNYRFMVAEWLWILAGRNDVASLERYNQKMRDFSDDGLTLAGAYGPRLLPQWPYLLNALRADQDTRQATATIFTPCPARSKDVPCTLSFQLLRRAGALHGVVTMRSSDAWLGLPYDFFTFSQLLNSMAAALAVRAGALTFHLGSSHLYEPHYDLARQVLAARQTSTLWSPQLLDYLSPKEATMLLDATIVPGPKHEFGPYWRALHEARTRAQALEVLRGKA